MRSVSSAAIVLSENCEAEQAPPNDDRKRKRDASDETNSREPNKSRIMEAEPFRTEWLFPRSSPYPQRPQQYKDSRGNLWPLGTTHPT